MGVAHRIPLPYFQFELVTTGNQAAKDGIGLCDGIDEGGSISDGG